MRRISWLMPVATSVAALALIAPAGALGTTACGDRFVPAVVGGKHRCLQWQMACRVRWNADYHRYLFDCHKGYLVWWWRGLLRRPLHIPTLTPGSACPVSPPTGSFGSYGATAFGPGPAYPTLTLRDGGASLTYLPGWGPEGADGTKLLAAIPPSHNGQLWAVDVRTGDARPLTPFVGDLYAQGLSNDGQTVLAAVGCGGMPRPYGYLETIPFAGGKPHVIVRGPCRASWNAP